MMSDTDQKQWQMEEWMREVLRVCKYSQADIDVADEYYDKTSQRVNAPNDHDMTTSIADTVLDLWQLHSAGLLITPGEKDGRALLADDWKRMRTWVDEHQDEFSHNYNERVRLVKLTDGQEAELTRLRAENERLREGLGFISHASIVPLYYRDIADIALGADHD